MAKTRIKTTPTRMQKEALMASAAVTTTTNIATEHVFKKRISVLKNSITAKEKIVPIQSTIIVQPPKRTNSISSTTSSISHTSEGTHSCAESPPPHIANAATQNNGPTMDELTESAIKTLNAGLLAKTNALALKNRKVYMITEKCDDTTSAAGHNSGCGNSGANGIATGQKRKMYLIMEEKDSAKNHGDHAEKLMRAENTNASKKLTLFTDTTNGQLPQKFEQILPEILNCIQAKKSNNSLPCNVLNGKTDIVTPELNGQHISASLLNTNTNTKFQMKSERENTERLPITLPPKKNRTKIITTQIIPVNPSEHAIYKANAIDNWAATPAGVVVSGVAANLAQVTTATNNNNGFCKHEKSCGATPVIVNATTLLATTNGNASVPTNGLKSKENYNSSKAAVNQLHKNINLSTDFLFLMKMLPKLESIEEPHKNYVKTCIEEIINQYVTQQNEEQ